MANTAQKTKIKNMLPQRRDIQHRIDSLLVGKISFHYEGEIFPEVIDYFKNDGWEVTLCENSNDNKLPVYYFNCANVNLSEKQMEVAMNWPDKPTVGEIANLLADI